jgi:hypothetical protein
MTNFSGVLDCAQIGQCLLEQSKGGRDLSRRHLDLSKHMFRKATDKLCRSDASTHLFGVRKVLSSRHYSNSTSK